MASLNINFLYDTQTLIGALKKISYPTRFFRDNFFPMKTYSFNEMVELDFRKVARAFAPKIRSRQSVPILKSKDRKSTRLNSSHQIISYAVFSLNQKSTRL